MDDRVSLDVAGGPLQVYEVLTRQIDRYTDRLQRAWPRRKRTESRLRQAEQTRRKVVGAIAQILGAECAASELRLSIEEVSAAQQVLSREQADRNSPAVEEFMARPENQRRLRSRVRDR